MKTQRHYANKKNGAPDAQSYNISHHHAQPKQISTKADQIGKLKIFYADTETLSRFLIEIIGAESHKVH